MLPKLVFLKYIESYFASFASIYCQSTLAISSNSHKFPQYPILQTCYCQILWSKQNFGLLLCLPIARHLVTNDLVT